jgi:hypothetical protein
MIPITVNAFTMKKTILFSMLLLSFFARAQSLRELSLALTNSNTAFPFSKFSSLFTTAFHPGFEIGYGFNWKTKPRHDWYQTAKVGYFFHRFVQHAIPIYTQFGYRYKFGQHWRLSSAMGAGYLHSIPATAVLKRSADGDYENGKGLGRSQVLLNLTFGVAYNWQLHKKPVSTFFAYQQQLQAPFVKSYVPLLPYNNVALGFLYSLTRK